jgi:hypothetical protein
VVQSKDEDVILPFPSPIVPARHARSTVLLGSIASIRDLGRYDEYASLLPPSTREVLLGAVAGAWIPIDIALSHYRACEALNLAPEQQVANGRQTFDKTRGTLMGTLVRMAKAGGMTPWTVYPHFQRFWLRGYDGGGIRVTRIGPKEARLELVAFPLNDSRYYRHALRGLVMAITELFCTKSYMIEKTTGRAPGTVSYRLQWA